MIPAATLKVGKKSYKLRFTTGALMRFEEDNNGQSCDVLFDKLVSGRGGVRLLVSSLEAGLNDGEGMDRQDVMAFVDAAGGVAKVSPFVADALTKAFPSPPDGSDDEPAGNGEKGEG